MQTAPADSSVRLTPRMRVRDWLGTKVPRHVFARIPGVMCRLPGAGRELSLTFDDGPHPVGTPLLLAALREFQAPATFFLLGERARRWPDLVRQILNEGHVLGNHSWAHLDCWKSTPQKIFREFSACQQLLEEMSGEPVRWLRPPFGHIKRPLFGWGTKKQVQTVLWDVIPPDYSPVHDVDRLQWICHRHLRNGSIICLHDNDNSAQVTPEFLRRMIPQALHEGWTFVPLRGVPAQRTD
ncbi:polysaccharide deacetylase family protein [Planctomicrobium sp. SH664]|uniref:polysaccharide deacetylase family protein n=1 Tax=Planctomicrobium sp. SH664 TaxID=3448125 RepID=UPI003F5CA2AC